MSIHKHLKEKTEGERCLILAIILTAKSDYELGGHFIEETRQYFKSDLYRHHLAWLGLPSDMLPEGVKL